MHERGSRDRGTGTEGLNRYPYLQEVNMRMRQNISLCLCSLFRPSFHRHRKLLSFQACCNLCGSRGVMDVAFDLVRCPSCLVEGELTSILRTVNLYDSTKHGRRMLHRVHPMVSIKVVIHIYIYIYVCMCTHVCVCTYTYTYIGSMSLLPERLTASKVVPSNQPADTKLRGAKTHSVVRSTPLSFFAL